MDLNKLSNGDRVVAVAGIVFLISMFFPWWGIELGAGFGDYTQNGTDYFLTGWLPLLIVIAMVGQIAISRFTTSELPKLPIPWSQVHVIAGGVVAVLLILRLAITSSDVPGPVDVDLEREWGLYIATLAAIAVGVGGFLKFQEGEDATAASSAPPQPF